MGLNGDIAFASNSELREMLLYCNKWSDRTFVLQTKNPIVFAPRKDLITPNMIIGTTIETDAVNYNLSNAPRPSVRYFGLRVIDCRKMVTIEPIMKFTEYFGSQIINLHPEIVYIGYDSKNNHLPEPTLAETHQLIDQLRGAGIDVREKLIRKAWDES